MGIKWTAVLFLCLATALTVVDPKAVVSPHLHNNHTAWATTAKEQNASAHPSSRALCGPITEQEILRSCPLRYSSRRYSEYHDKCPAEDGFAKWSRATATSKSQKSSSSTPLLTHNPNPDTTHSVSATTASPGDTALKSSKLSKRSRPRHGTLDFTCRARTYTDESIAGKRFVRRVLATRTPGGCSRHGTAVTTAERNPTMSNANKETCGIRPEMPLSLDVDVPSIKLPIKEDSQGGRSPNNADVSVVFNFTDKGVTSPGEKRTADAAASSPERLLASGSESMSRKLCGNSIEKFSGSEDHAGAAEALPCLDLARENSDNTAVKTSGAADLPSSDSLADVTKTSPGSGHGHSPSPYVTLQVTSNSTPASGPCMGPVQKIAHASTEVITCRTCDLSSHITSEPPPRVARPLSRPTNSPEMTLGVATQCASAEGTDTARRDLFCGNDDNAVEMVHCKDGLGDNDGASTNRDSCALGEACEDCCADLGDEDAAGRHASLRWNGPTFSVAGDKKAGTEGDNRLSLPLPTAMDGGNTNTPPQRDTATSSSVTPAHNTSSLALDIRCKEKRFEADVAGLYLLVAHPQDLCPHPGEGPEAPQVRVVSSRVCRQVSMNLSSPLFSLALPEKRGGAAAELEVISKEPRSALLMAVVDLKKGDEVCVVSVAGQESGCGDCAQKRVRFAAVLLNAA